MEDPMRSRKAIDDELQDLEIDDQESKIDEEVKDRRQRPLEHLLLSEGYQQNIPPPFGCIARNGFLFAKCNVPFYSQYSFPDKEYGNTEGDQKSNLLKDHHVNKVLLLSFIPITPGHVFQYQHVHRVFIPTFIEICRDTSIEIQGSK